VTYNGHLESFVEGPCNSVNQILLKTCEKGKESIEALVGSKDFNLNVFDQNSNFHLVYQNIKMD
jgi:hypothetical protein